MAKGRNGKSGKKTTDNALDKDVPDLPAKESADSGKPLLIPASASVIGPFEAPPELPIASEHDAGSRQEKADGEEIAEGEPREGIDAESAENDGDDNAQPAETPDDEDDGYLSDDSDEHLEPDSLYSILALKRFSLTLLVPISSKVEVKRAAITVAAMLNDWQELLSPDVLQTTTYQDLTPMYLSRERYGRLQVTFNHVRDANFVWSQIIRHECINGDFIDLTWQHPEDARFLRERVLNPTTKEVVIKGVPGMMTAELFRCLLVVSKLVKRGRSAFASGFGFHRTVDPVSGLFIPHADDEYRWRYFVEDPTTGKHPAVILTSTGGAREEWVCVQSACEKAQGNRFKQASAHIASARHKGGMRKEGSATRASKFSQKLLAFKKEYIVKPLKILLRKEELLEVYKKSYKEKLQAWAGIEAELEGEVASGTLSAQIKTRKAKTAIREVSRNGTTFLGVKEVLSAATDHFREAFICAGGGAAPATEDHPMQRQLGEKSRRSLSAPWTEEEVWRAVRELAPGKSLGADGLPKELFDHNWDLLGPVLMDLIRRFTRGEELPQNVTTAMTIQLHKKGEKGDLGNHRPITLLSTVYKIVSKVMASRLKRVLHEVISEDQYGFIPGRQLADAVATVADAIEAGANGKEGWYLLMIDFQKAFDSISRDYLFNTLQKLGLPEEFLTWMEGLHREAGTRLHINGWRGKMLQWIRGCAKVVCWRRICSSARSSRYV
ncbi:unnamed protein product [Closterium sp. NIES-65]|nr:unnamed protein product [Closterium sp. NIES-65]